MTRLAKAVSAFNFGRSAQGAGRDARSFAGRGASLGADGSGAPPHAQALPGERHYRATAIVAGILSMTLLALVFVSLATANKRVSDVFAGTGSTGNTEGAFNIPRDIGVNDTTGDVYVIDNNNHRVQRFEADGTFVSAWGRGVDTGATAAEICTSSCQAGSIGSAEGEFNNPQGIDVNQETGDVYVRDRTNNRVQRFDEDGNFISTWGWDVAAPSSPDNTGTGFEICTTDCKVGVTGANGGQFATSTTASTGLAIDPTSGNVYVSDPVNRRVQEFEADGSFLRLWGWDVVNTGQPGNVGTNNFEICSSTAAGVCKVAGTSGTDNGRFGNNQPLHLAVDTNGIVYASDSNVSNRVLRFDSTESAPADLLDSAIPVNTLFNTTSTSAIESNPANDHLLIARGTGILELDLSANPDPVEAAHVVETHTPGISLNGLDVDTATGNFYASSSSGHSVYVLDEVEPPEVQIQPASNVGTATAILNATIDPTGTPTGYRFEISANGVDWTSVPETNAPAGSGSGPVAVSAPAAGLQANTLYRVRVVATKPPTGSLVTETVTSPELTFLTDTAPPSAETLSPTARTSTSAKLVGRVNPNGTLTNYRFQWGKTTAYGNQAPIPAGNAGMTGTPTLVVDEIAGLEPGTTYHYRVIAQSPEGIATGNNVSFTTRPALSSPARAYEMVTPPFKVTRATGTPQNPPGDNPNPTIPSLDGTRVVWNVNFLPLTDDVAGTHTGDKRIIRRTSNGWVNTTRNTLPFIAAEPALFPASPGPALLTKVKPSGSSGDFETIGWVIADNNVYQSGVLPSEGIYANRRYTVREGTGVKGFTPWLTNPERQIFDAGFAYTDLTLNSSRGADGPTIFNDDGTAQAGAGFFRGIGNDEFDPSVVEQLGGPAGGHSIYMRRAGDADQLPSIGKELVNECTGTASEGDATEIPARIGTGAATDTIGVQTCEASDGQPAAVGTGIRTHQSNVVTEVDTKEGQFEVGQVVAGKGISSGTKITAVGADSLTLSAPANGLAAGGNGINTTGSTKIDPIGGRNFGIFEIGQIVVHQFFPAGTTIVDVGVNSLTLSNPATGSFPFLTTFTTIDPKMEVEIVADEGGRLTNVRGATLGGSRGLSSSAADRPNAGTAATALSDDGSRVFFQSPDYLAGPAGSEFGSPSPHSSIGSCASSTGSETACPPQLFVRQYDTDGKPMVRWISRSRSTESGSNSYGGPMIDGQQIGEMGNGVAFEGASRDGRYAYFRTNAPLTPDDPNGGVSITSGSAQGTSWDLYRYELPTNLDDDPGDGKLLRVSGGVTGNADPGVGRSSPIGDSALRFHSDDGRRAYFVTTAPIAGTDATPPKGATTAPGGEPGNGTNASGMRNLYLFDDNETGVDRYKFIAQLPYSRASSGTAAGAYQCATSFTQVKDHFREGEAERGNCMRGTPDGSGIVFPTIARLTADDTDNAVDLYLYEAENDELTRISAPPPGAEPYACMGTDAAPIALCNADLGKEQGNGFFSAPIGNWETERGWGGMRYYNMARDGNGVLSVFFHTKLQLVPEDVNGSFMDVYEWRNGRLSLISRGTADSSAWYSGNSVDGRDVFFNTGDRIDPREVDPDDLDVYDARVGGGFPFTPPPTPCNVLALQCEGEAIAGAAARGSATAGFSGSGNLRPAAARCNKKQVRRGKRCVAKKALARRACAKRKGKAKRRCVRNQVQRLTKVQQRQNKANKTGRASR